MNDCDFPSELPSPTADQLRNGSLARREEPGGAAAQILYAALATYESSRLAYAARCRIYLRRRQQVQQSKTRPVRRDGVQQGAVAPTSKATPRMNSLCVASTWQTCSVWLLTPF
jgi:hypothetical protein